MGLAKQGKLPGRCAERRPRLLNSPAARGAKPGPQDTVQRPFYDLWAKAVVSLLCQAQAFGCAVTSGSTLRVSLRVFGSQVS